MQYTEQLRRRSPTEIGLMALVFVFLMLIVYTLIPEAPADLVTNFCPQPPALNLSMSLTGLDRHSDELGFSTVANTKSYSFKSSQSFYTNEYGNFSLEAFQGAIRIPTMSFDDMDKEPKKDSRFEVFHELHKYLHSKFPLAAKHAETVNTYGLLYTFEGSNPSLRPVVLMAHQDVVPVPEETVDQWQHPPFEAHYDGEFIHGRGTADTKDTVVGILESVEALLQQDWTPQRTLIVSFGFDEEVGGVRGASHLARAIEQRYGVNGAELVVDEGFGMPSLHGSLVGAVAVAEKGYMDVGVNLTMPGGHSSSPPDHTSIGIMSELVKRLEAHPLLPELENSNPVLGFYRCLAEHAPAMDKEFRRTVLDIDCPGHRKHLIRHISDIPAQKYWIRTSQAADLIHGGIKLNALPEQVELKVNHRIDMNSGSAALIDRFEDIVVSVAEDFGLGVQSNGETLLDATDKGIFTISTLRAIEPSPISPHSGQPWEILAGTTRSIIDAAPFTDTQKKPLVMAPVLFGANTDTRHFWQLTRAIYRFKPALAEDMINYHTVDERLRFRSHLMTVAWYYEFILNSTS